MRQMECSVSPRMYWCAAISCAASPVNFALFAIKLDRAIRMRANELIKRLTLFDLYDFRQFKSCSFRCHDRKFPSKNTLANLWNWCPAWRARP